MYTENDLSTINKKIHRNQIILIILCIVSLVSIIVSFVYRQKILSIVFTIISVSLIYFYISIFFIPKIKYKKFITDILDHNTKNARTVEGIVQSISEESVFYDGIESNILTLKIGQDVHGDVLATFYIDVEKSLKDIKISDNLIFKLFDRFIIGIQS